MFNTVVLEEVINNLVGLNSEIHILPYPVVCEIYEKALNDLRFSYWRYRRYRDEREEIEQSINRFQRSNASDKEGVSNGNQG